MVDKASSPSWSPFVLRAKKMYTTQHFCCAAEKLRAATFYIGKKSWPVIVSHSSCVDINDDLSACSSPWCLVLLLARLDACMRSRRWCGWFG